MTFKTSFPPAAHQSSTYMELFCKQIHPDLEMGKVCVTWFRQAISHCTDLMSEARASTTFFWRAVKKFLFPDRTTSIMWHNISVPILPNRLSLYDCQSLFLEIVNDYVQRAPLYAAESATNSMLWRLLYFLLGFIALFIAFLGTLYAYYKYCRTKKTINVLEELFKPEKRMQVIAARSLRLAKTELRRLKLMPCATDGSDSLILKVDTKYDILESVLQGCVYAQQEKLQTDLKIEKDKYFDVKEIAAKQIKTRLLPPTKISPRFLKSNPKQTFNTHFKGEGAGPNQPVEAGTGYKSPRSRLLPPTPNPHNTPQSTNTPRSSSGIPRNVQKTSPRAKKSK